LDPQYGAYYRRLYETHWWFRMRERWVLEAIRRHVPTAGWRRILDVGCGDALLFDQLESFGLVEGVETDQNLVSPTNPHLAQIFFGPFDQSFAPRKLYGLILMLDVLEHLPDPQSALCRAASLLENDGILLITVPAYKLAWTNHDDLNHHRTRYRKATLFPLIESANLNVLESAYWFHSVFPVKLAQRVVQRIFRMPPENPRIPSQRLNRLLMRVCSVEHRLLTAIRMPLGTTLFVRCNKLQDKHQTVG